MPRCHLAVELCSDGSVVLNDGQRISHVDTIIYCTGKLAPGLDFVSVPAASSFPCHVM